MPTEHVYCPKYTNSRALVIGINTYHLASPLGYARSDAEAVAALLRDRFGFPSSSVTVLLDAEATRARIMGAFLSYANQDVEPDDRILVFFAGHGYTRPGRRGETGYLVPVDGTSDDLSTLIRWDELTRSAELVLAKHVLFIMDACYGGLAVTRSLSPGSMRFLTDMLQRYSRQVLAAGKADEVVADANGPRPGHSIFTGHLLNALEGEAASPEGIISANAVMAYVYEKVAKDQYSQQSPHFGFIDGDGDFIFDAPPLKELAGQSGAGDDVAIQIPPGMPESETTGTTDALPELVKEYLADRRYLIRLDDLVVKEVKAALYHTREEVFSLTTPEVTPEEFANRLRRYEAEFRNLERAIVLLARWGEEHHEAILEKALQRIADNIERKGGKVAWLGLRWFPILRLLYAGSIAALSAGKYANLQILLMTSVHHEHGSSDERELIVAAVGGVLEVERLNLFKKLPGHERYYTPKSEYLFKSLQSAIDDLLFLGRSYEELFDRCEMFLALTHADLVERRKGNGHFWGPPGRFAWKRDEPDPFRILVAEAKQAQADWRPLKAGLFQRSLGRFETVSSYYQTELLDKLTWF